MQLNSSIRSALDSTGLPWKLIHGKRHRKIIVDGKMVGILPRKSKLSEAGCDRSMLNVISQIRRAARGQ